MSHLEKRCCAAISVYLLSFCASITRHRSCDCGRCLWSKFFKLKRTAHADRRGQDFLRVGPQIVRGSNTHAMERQVFTSSKSERKMQQFDCVCRQPDFQLPQDRFHRFFARPLINKQYSRNLESGSQVKPRGVSATSNIPISNVVIHVHAVILFYSLHRNTMRPLPQKQGTLTACVIVKDIARVALQHLNDRRAVFV